MLFKSRVSFIKKFLSANVRQVSHTVVMIRHGESVWNVTKQFTGWCDISLTEMGEADALDAGTLLGARGMKFDVAFTSTLERAWKTCDIVLKAAGQTEECETIKSWKLNERHYGALQGHYKDSPQLEDIYGEEKILEWRRSYDTAPPSLYDKQFAENMGSQQHSRRATTLMNPRYLDTRMMNRSVRSSISDPSYGNNGFTEYNDFPYPSAESLKECEERAFGFWRDVIAPRVLAGDRVLIVSHANTIRALVKAVDQIDDSMIAHLKIPNGIPLVYTLDSNLQPILDLTDDLGFQGEYLVSARNHGKMMEYERCVRKKLRSLFEYLDTDKDGRITPSCLQSGMIRLQAYDKTKKESDDAPQICEYEIEELLRAVPSADEHGGVTLKTFLKAQATLLPMLSKLRLLQ